MKCGTINPGDPSPRNSYGFFEPFQHTGNSAGTLPLHACVCASTSVTTVVVASLSNVAPVLVRVCECNTIPDVLVHHGVWPLTPTDPQVRSVFEFRTVCL